MANQFDRYTPFQYIPVPFESYLKAGEMQQGKYDETKEQLNKVQDLIAAMPAKSKDIAGKNAILNRFMNDASSVLDNNKHYNPNMSQQVRELARKYANSPEIASINKHYKLEEEHRKMRDALKAQGKLWEYDTDMFDKASVDEQGVITDYGKKGEYSLGFEESLNHVEAADKIVSQIAPFVKDLGAQIIYKSVYDPATGKTNRVPYLSDTKLSELIKTDPRVQKFIKDNIPSFLSDSPGKQFSRMKNYDFMKNGKDNYNAYFDKINPQTGNVFTKEEVAKIYEQDAVKAFLESRIKEVSIRDDQNKPMSKAEMLALGFGKDESKDPFVIDELAKVATGISKAGGSGKTEEFQEINEGTIPEYIKDEWLSKDQMEAARKRAGDRFKQFAESEKAREESIGGRDVTSGGSPGSRRYQTQEDLDRYVAEEIQVEKEKLIKTALKNPKNKYTSSVVPIPVEAIPTLKQTFYQFKASDVILSGGVSPDKRGTSLDKILGEDYNNEVGLPSLIEDFTPVDQVSLKIPGRKSTVPMVRGYVKVSTELFDKLSKSDKDFIRKNSKGDSDNLTIQVSVPADRFYTSGNALSVNQQYKTFDKDLDYQSIYENNTNVISQLPYQKEADFEYFEQNNNKIVLQNGESIQFEPATEMVYRVNAQGKPTMQISLAEYSLRNLQAKGQKIIQ